MDGIIIELLNEFTYFVSDKDYYQRIITALNYTESDLYDEDGIFLEKVKTKITDEARQKVLEDINKSIYEGNITWLVNFLEFSAKGKKDFRFIADTFALFQIDITVSLFQTLLDSSPSFAALFNLLLPTSEKYSDEYIENLAKSQMEFDLLYTFATIKDIIDLGIDDEEEDIDSDRGYDDYYSEDIQAMIVHQAKRLKNFEKNPEYFKKYNMYKNISETTKDEKEKEKALKMLKEYSDRIVEANQMLVVQLTHKYRGRGLDFEDLWGYGNIGLMTAIERFDPTKGYHFSTYATWWIRQAMSRNLVDFGLNKAYRIPAHAQDFHSKVFRATNALRFELMRDPEPEEIAERLGTTPEKVEEDIKVFAKDVSLDSKIDPNDSDADTDFYNYTPDPNNDVENFINETSHKGDIERYLSYVSQKEEKVLRMRFGYADGIHSEYDEPHTLEATGQKFNVTRERIRQIETKAIRRIRRIEKININNVEAKNIITSSFWANFKGKDRSFVTDKIKYLSKEDQADLYGRYDADLRGFNDLGKNANRRASEALRKVVKMVENPDYKPTYKTAKNGPVITYCINPLTGEKEVLSKSSFPYEGKTITEVLGENYQEKLDLMAEDDLILFKNAFGDAYEDKANTDSFDKAELNKLKNLITKNKQTKKGRVYKRSFYGLAKCNYIELLAALQQIENENWLHFAKELFGDNYQRLIDYNSLSEEQRKLLDDICYNVNLRVKKKRAEIKSKNKSANAVNKYAGKKVHEILNCSIELAEYIISSKEKMKTGKILRKQDDGEVLRSDEIKELYRVISKILDTKDRYQMQFDALNNPKEKPVLKTNAESKKTNTKESIDLDEVSNQTDMASSNSNLINKLASMYGCSTIEFLEALEGEEIDTSLLVAISSGKEPTDAMTDKYYTTKNYLKSKIRRAKNDRKKAKIEGEDMAEALLKIFNCTKDELAFATKDIAEGTKEYEMLVLIASEKEPKAEDISVYLTTKMNVKININAYRQRDLVEQKSELSIAAGAPDKLPENNDEDLANKSIAEILGCSLDLAEFIISSKKKDSKEYKAFEKIMNGQTLTSNDERLIRRVASYVKPRMEVYSLEFDKKKRVLASENIIEKISIFYDCTLEEAEYAFRNVQELTKYPTLLKILNYEELSPVEAKAGYKTNTTVRMYITEYRSLQNNNESQLLSANDPEFISKFCAYFECTESESQDVLSHFSKKTKSFAIIAKIINNEHINISDLATKETVIRRIRKYLNEIRNYVPVSYEEEFIQKFCTYFECNEEEMREVLTNFKENSRSYNAIEGIINDDILESEREISISVRSRIRDYIAELRARNLKLTVTKWEVLSEFDFNAEFCRYFNCNAKEMDYALRGFDVRSKKYHALENFLKGEDLDLSEVYYLYVSENEIKISINEFRENEEISEEEMLAKLCAIFDCEAQELKIILGRKNKNKKSYDVLRKIALGYALKGADSARYSQVKKDIQEKLQVNREKEVLFPTFAERDALCKKFGYSKEEMDFVLKGVKRGTKRYNVLDKISHNIPIKGVDVKYFDQARDAFSKKLVESGFRTKENEKQNNYQDSKKLDDNQADYLEDPKFVEEFCEFFDCSKEEMQEALSHFDKTTRSYRLFKYIFNYAGLDTKDKYLCKNLRQRIRKYIEDGRNTVYSLEFTENFCRYFECTEKEMQSILKHFNKNSARYQIILAIINGEDLTGYTKKNIYDITYDIRKMLNDERQEKYNQLPLPETLEVVGEYTTMFKNFFQCSDEMMSYALERTNKNKKEYIILKKYLNGKSLTEVEKPYYYQAVEEMKRLLATYQEYENDLASIEERLCVIYDCTIDEIDEIICAIGINSKSFNSLKQIASGIDPKCIENTKERILHYNVKNRIPKKLEQLRAKKSEDSIYACIDLQEVLAKKLGLTVPDTQELLKTLRRGTKKEAALEKLARGQELSETEKDYVHKTIKYFKSNRNIAEVVIPDVKEEEPVEILTPEPYEGPASPLTHPFFKELIKLFPLEYRHVTELKLGIYDGVMYDDATIATLYNTTEDDIRLRVAKGKLLFDRIMQEYTNVFEHDFPNIDVAVNQSQLLREKKTD